MQRNVQDILATLELAAARKRFRKKDYFIAYPKQQEFFDLGMTKRERLLMAGNQEGKTYAGAFEVACHLTGEYPDDWMGRRWDRPVKAWAAGESGGVVRGTSQKLLCGEPGVEEAFGSGFIPKEAFVGSPSMARGIANAYDTIQVRHKSGGVSILQFKSYEQGRTKFQADTLDFIWWDEEPDEDIYGEGLARITATAGMMFMTFTPLKGITKVVGRFLSEYSPDRSVVTMTIMDALHISADERQKIIAGYPAHEREARVNGIPMLGEGRIFQIAEGTISEPAVIEVPLHWAKVWGVDFGIGDGHPFAAALLAWDRDADIIHVLHTLRMTSGTPLEHAVPMKTLAASVPVAWPHDGGNREKGTGDELQVLYRRQNLAMLPNHSVWAEGGNSVEAGLMEMTHRFATGRLKVAAHLTEFWEEYRMYHRKKGMIVKAKDDILDAIRVALMSLRFAKALPLGNKRALNRNRSAMCQGLDFDLFAT